MVTLVRPTPQVQYILDQRRSFLADQFYKAQQDFSFLVDLCIVKMCDADDLEGLIKFCSEDWGTFFTYFNVQSHMEKIARLLGEEWRDSLSYHVLLKEEHTLLKQSVKDDLAEKRADVRPSEEVPKEFENEASLCLVDDYTMNQIAAACTKVAITKKSLLLCQALLDHQRFDQDEFERQALDLNPFALALYENFDCLLYNLEDFIKGFFSRGVLVSVLQGSEFICNQFIDILSEQPGSFLTSFSCSVDIHSINRWDESWPLCQFLIQNFPEEYVAVIFTYIDESMRGDAGFKRYAGNHAVILRHLLQEGSSSSPDVKEKLLDAIGFEMAPFSIESNLRERWSCVFQESSPTAFSLNALVRVAWSLKDDELKGLAVTKIGDYILSPIRRGGNAILHEGSFWEAVFGSFNSLTLPSHLKLTQEQSEELERLLMKKADDENLSPQSRLKFHLAAEVCGKHETISTDGSAIIFEKLWASSKDRPYLRDILLKVPYEYFAKFFEERREVFPALYNIGAGMLRSSFSSQPQ